MRPCIFIMLLTILLVSSGMAAAQQGIADDAATFENNFIRFMVPDGWTASEIKPEVHEDIATFDDELKCVPVEVLPDDDSAGLMLLASGRDDTLGTLYDFIVLMKSSQLEIYELYEGEYDLIDARGVRHGAKLTINAVDDGESMVLISHDIILFIGSTRFEFAYLAPIEEYARNYASIEEIISSMEFLD